MIVWHDRHIAETWHHASREAEHLREAAYEAYDPEDCFDHDRFDAEAENWSDLAGACRRALLNCAVPTKQRHPS